MQNLNAKMKIIIPNPVNNFLFKPRESCRQIEERKWHCIGLILRHLRSSIFDALTRLNRKLFTGFGIALLKVLLIALILHGCGCGKISGKQKIRIGVDPSWYPLNFGSQTAYVNGFIEDLLLEIAKSEKIQFVRIDVNSGDLVPGLKEGKYDAVLTSMHPFAFHVAKYDFSKNFLEVGPVLIVGTKSPYEKLNKIKGETVGILLGDAAGGVLEVYPEISIHTYPTIPDLLNAVAAGEIAGALLNKIPAVNYVSDLYSNQLKIATPPLTNEGIHLIARKGEKEDAVRLFDRRLKAMKRKKIPKLLEKWSLN